ncbi:MAG: YkgJ family cysteine cluster protein [Nitrospirae bacterium]|nr:MAG: YkgJ family cysteine cluster protein [Nitrospirota bacterium]
MTEDRTVERLDVSVNTPAGPVTVPVEVPLHFVPVAAIVPSIRRIGEAAQALEERDVVMHGAAISCKKGCAACCRMLIPLAAPEAFALADAIRAWPAEQREAVLTSLADARAQLERTGVLPHLYEIAESERQLDDDTFEPINRAYYALRLPCPFLVEEVCSIYDDRPAACRELLVTSPAELCQDLERNPVRPVPIPLRVGTVLALLWADLIGGPARFIPLPLALEWAERHRQKGGRSWQGREMLERALDKVWWYLSREVTARQRVSHSSSSRGQERPQP